MYLQRMQEVIRRVLEGDGNAFRKIVQEYSELLLGFARRILNDEDDARDATQISLIKVYRNLHRYKPDYPLKPWIYKIHLNTCRSMYRQRKMRSHDDIETLHLSDKRSERLVEEGPDFEVIQGCLDKLTWKQGIAFQLMAVEGFSADEAAVTMKCAPATARVHLMRARQNLQVMLKELGYERHG